ncbi:hypothetical protein BD770DRAFT_409802 [Pilaira anomala]|nr:hypothetical protein BD770DRAFT_409802 [Pilaira anomala]
MLRSPMNKIRLLHRESSKSESAIEQDFLGEVWTPVLSTIFSDKVFIAKLVISYISELSSLAKKKKVLPDGTILGDRVDLRVLTKTDDSTNDVCNCDFTNDKLGSEKISSDHLKLLLLESKNIL